MTTEVAALDLEAYLGRIGYKGSRTPTLATLAAIQLRHTHAIAFENLNPLLGWPVRLDLASLEQKLVHAGRGGYCFEHNLLLAHALEALGFKLTRLAGRVLLGAPGGTTPARTHMLLQVEVEGRAYLVDAGFGGQVPTGPLRLEPDLEQATPHEPYRLLRAADGFTLQAWIGGAWKTLYQFDLTPQLQIDYEVGNHYVATHPASFFVDKLVAARPATGRRYTLLDKAFAEHPVDGTIRRRTLATAAELAQTLRDVFGLTLPGSPALDAMLQRIAARPA